MFDASISISSDFCIIFHLLERFWTAGNGTKKKRERNISLSRSFSSLRILLFLPFFGNVQSRRDDDDGSLFFDLFVRPTTPILKREEEVNNIKFG